MDDILTSVDARAANVCGRSMIDGDELKRALGAMHESLTYAAAYEKSKGKRKIIAAQDAMLYRVAKVVNDAIAYERRRR